MSGPLPPEGTARAMCWLTPGDSEVKMLVTANACTVADLLRLQYGLTRLQLELWTELATKDSKKTYSWTKRPEAPDA